MEFIVFLSQKVMRVYNNTIVTWAGFVQSEPRTFSYHIAKVVAKSVKG